MKKSNITQKYTQFTKIVNDLKTRFADNSNILETIDANATKVWNACVKTALPIALVVSMLVGLVACETHSPIDDQYHVIDGWEQTYDPNYPSSSTPGTTTSGDTDNPYVTTDPNTTNTPGTTNNPDTQESCYNIFDVRPIADIKSTGVTSKDVLAYYDKVIRELVIQSYDFQEGELGDTIIYLENIMPNRYTYGMDNEYTKFGNFVVNNPAIKPSHDWLSDTTSQYYTPTIPKFSKMCLISLHVGLLNTKKGKLSKHTIDNILVPYPLIKELMALYNVKSEMITEENYSSFKPAELAFEHRGDTAYLFEGLSREDIWVADESQLINLFNILQNIESINLHALPASSENLIESPSMEK